MTSSKHHQISVDLRGQFLCCVLADDPEWHRREAGELWRKLGDDAAWEFARTHEAEGAAAIALETALGAPAVPERWRAARERVEQRISTYMRELDRIALALHVSGVPLVALKNSGIARGIYRKLGACPMGDVDLLVRPHDFAQAHAVFAQNGFQFLGNQDVGRAALGARIGEAVDRTQDAELEADMLSGGREYSLSMPGQEPLWFELQCRSVGGKWISKDAEPPPDALVERSEPIEGTSVRILCPVHNLLQVCLHTAKHTFVRVPGFRLHTDVDRIVRHTRVDWEEFCRAVETLGVRTPVYLSLAIPALMLRTPVPERVLTRLNFAPRKHRIMLRWLGRVGWFNPKQKKWSKLGYIGFNLLLYDTISGIFRAVFPDSAWIIKRYEVKRRWTMPIWYIVRAFELMFKRYHT